MYQFGASKKILFTLMIRHPRQQSGFEGHEFILRAGDNVNDRMPFSPVAPSEPSVGRICVIMLVASEIGKRCPKVVPADDLTTSWLPCHQFLFVNSVS